MNFNEFFEFFEEKPKESIWNKSYYREFYHKFENNSEDSRKCLPLPNCIFCL